MFLVAERGLTDPLTPVQTVSNQVYVAQFTSNLLQQAFPHLQEFVHQSTVLVRTHITTLGRSCLSLWRVSSLWTRTRRPSRRTCATSSCSARCNHTQSHLLTSHRSQEVAGADMTDLYLAEREAQLREVWHCIAVDGDVSDVRQAAEEKTRRAAAVPGMLDPHTLANTLNPNS